MRLSATIDPTDSMATLFSRLQAFLLLSCAVHGTFAAAVISQRSAPTATLDSATVVGVTSGSVSQFLGIPFAEPPVGDLRYQLPQTIAPYSGTVNASSYSPSCFQQELKYTLPSGLAENTTEYLLETVFYETSSSSEDCLYLNIFTPSNFTTSSKLPVAVWFYGGSFQTGDASLYDGTNIVEGSQALEEPVIVVTFNYRLSGLGFLASKEVKAAGVGNLGLQDQRKALQWVQKYIGQFGGDSSRVTLWGQSAGAQSIGYHMLSNGGDTQGLFHAAFMESGSPLPGVGDITEGQAYYNFIVDSTGCSGASDTLACLRTVSYDNLTAVINETPIFTQYPSLDFTWQPLVDGVFLTDTPQNLITQGSVARVPVVNGDNDDEGTAFALASTNITTSAEFSTYIKTYFYPNATASQLTQVLKYYPENVTKGSPYNTGTSNALTSQFKRVASFLGDRTFQAPRRFFLKNISGKQNTWSYLSKQLKSLPVIGSAHASEILNVWYGGNMATYLINFVNDFTPNGPGGNLEWPEYTVGSPELMTFLDNETTPLVVSSDTYREKAIEYLIQLDFVTSSCYSLKYHAFGAGNTPKLL